MKVYELIEKLNRYNPKADVEIVVHGTPKEFEICYGGSDGCTPETCENVVFLIDTPLESC